MDFKKIAYKILKDTQKTYNNSFVITDKMIDKLSSYINTTTPITLVLVLDIVKGLK